MPTSPRLIKVSDEQDGQLLNRGYSYWSQVWVNEGANAYLCFCGHADGHARFFQVDRSSGAVTRVGTPFPLLPYQGTTEGWYFGSNGRITLCDGPRLRSVNPLGMGVPEDDIIIASIEVTHPGCRLFQAHSSADGQLHSATVQQIVESGPYPSVGTVAIRNREQQWFDAVTYNLDESQIDASGRYLLIKSSPDDDNLIIDLQTGEQRPWWTKAEGSVGHSDSGDGFLVGADRAHGTCVRVDLSQQTPHGIPLYDSWSVGHVAVKGQTCIVSDETHINRVSLSGGGITPLIEHGMVNPYSPEDPRSYDFQTFGNISPDESAVAFMSNKYGRMDAFLLML